jgi:hypothetical protein
VPSDQKLVRQFYKKRPDLERLVSMLADDSRMTRIAPDFLWTEDSVAWPRPESQWGISRARWDEYKSSAPFAQSRTRLVRNGESTLLDARRPPSNVPHAETNFRTPSKGRGHLPAEQFFASPSAGLASYFCRSLYCRVVSSRLVLREDAAHAYGLHGERPRKGIPQILRIDSFPISGAIGLLGRSDDST